MLSVATFAGLLAVFALAIALGERGGEEFFDNLLLALPGLGAYVAAVGAFVFGALAIVLAGERSLTVVAATIFGLLVTTFGVLEVLFPH
ncbi:MAG: hypothetical protein AAFN30_08580 [Actinomycetota bacterium]